MGQFRIKQRSKQRKKERIIVQQQQEQGQGYKIKLTPDLAAQLNESIRERDDYQRSAQEKLAEMGKGLDRQVNAIIAMSGHDTKEPRGNVQVQPIDGEMFLVVQPPPGPRPVSASQPQPPPQQQKGFRPGKGPKPKVNGAPQPQSDAAAQPVA